MSELETGQTVDATITRVKRYGALARVSDGVEGLIHVSERAGEGVGDPSGSVHAGDVLSARMAAIDGDRRRVSPSVRLAERT